MLKRIIIIALLLSLSLANPSVKDFQSGKKAWQAQNYLKAHSFFEKAAKNKKLKDYAGYYSLSSAVYSGKTELMKPFLNIVTALSASAPYREDTYLLQQAARQLCGVEIPAEDKFACAKYFLTKKQFGMAKVFYSSCAQEKAYYQASSYGLIEALLGEGKREEARALLNKLPFSERKLYWLGRLSPYRQRLTYYKQLIANYPKSNYLPEAALTLFYYHKKFSNYTEMLNYLNVLKKNEQYFSVASFEKGYIYYSLKKYRYALANFKAVRPSSVYYPAALYWQAKTYKRLGSNKQTEELFTKIGQEYPLSFYAYRVKQIENIGPDLQQIEQEIVKPHYFKRLPARARLLLQAQAYDDAFYELETSFPDKKEYWHILANHLVTEKQYQLLTKVNKYLKNPRYLYPLAYQAEIKAATERFPLEPALILAVMRQESGFDERVVSWAQAQGLMQLIPSTAQMCAERLKIETYDVFKPEDNILFGTYYLSSLVTAYHSAVDAIAAYNCGPGNLASFKRDEDIDVFIENITLRETRDYVKKVLANYWAYSLLYEEITGVKK